MHTFVTYFNGTLGILTIAANILSLALLAAVISPKVRASTFAGFFRKRAYMVALAASLVATLGSLIYSDVIGYEPCKLCWFQRIFMYPQAIIFALALWKRDAMAAIYGMTLSAVGAAIALFHYIGQIGWNPLGLDCLAVGYSASCAKNFVMIYGYVTIPFMALSAFALILLTLILSRLKQGDTNS
jgi:disulfide bond formation protein DsbB